MSPTKDFSSDDPRLAAYATRVFRPEDEPLAAIRERALAAGMPAIHVGSMDGLHLEVITRAIGARRVVEIGTLAGYSGVCLLRGMPADGHLDTFEFEPLHAEVARDTFLRAGYSHQVDIHVGPAAENLAKIESKGPFDLVFVDADKTGYPQYLAWAADNLRVGGLLLGDNTFGFGMIDDERIDDDEDRAAVEALRRFNELAAHGGRFRSTILPTGEGLTAAVKLR